MAIAILAILASIGYPAARDWVHFTRTRTISAQLSSHLALARASAIARGQPVAISPQSMHWESGWRVHLDPNANGQWDEGEAVLALHEGDRRVRIQAQGAAQRYVLFDPSGRPIQHNGAFLASAFLVCTPSTDRLTALVMNAAGRVRAEPRWGPCPVPRVSGVQRSQQSAAVRDASPPVFVFWPS
ncbi:GspH/FimT family pseudopilin [Caldimonas manganoxidans]|uniref:GspH/FimT family pseudopilin n=1 Tax=Caldimonas manganoxidans TaxID=196015 RepID=UPI000477923E|nr:GspH/FimT family pseudopilin [Caldimonas manganoxidans]